ncbi:MAG: glutathione S-transferase [Ponticaulis sp.]|nr:glutathione S-transferase [Ponticaulis sp.]|tara:strand:+ start:167291 stop:167956 length:666 start_codon:yes stop_codon:yes gene_type:complete
MITVHHLENSRSLRILWLLEELGADFQVKTYKRNPKTNLAPEDYKALHPLGKAPVVTDGDITLAETGAIVEYFLDKFPNSTLRPHIGTPERIPYQYWMHASEGSLMSLLVLGLFLTRMETAPPFPIKQAVQIVTKKIRGFYHTPSLTSMYEYMNAELSQRTWFAGATLTGADIMMSYPVEAAAGRAGLDDRYPNILAWLERVQALPAYQRAVETGGALEAM